MQCSSGRPPVFIQAHARAHTRTHTFSFCLSPPLCPSLPFLSPIPSLSSFLSSSSEDAGKSSLSAQRALSLIRPDLGHRVHEVTMTTSIPGYPSGGKDQLKGPVISLGHTVFILSSRPCTVLYYGRREGEQEISGFYFF